MEQSYKEKYEWALSVAKETYDKQPMYREWLVKMFPELKESEDEKIRKSLLNYLHTLPNHFSHKGGLVTDWLAWLEKQGEKKPIIDIEIPFGAKDSELQEVTYYIPKSYYAKIEDDKVVIKKGEQKSLNDVAKEVTKNKETAISFLKSCDIMNANGELAYEYKIEQDEQKPAELAKGEDYGIDGLWHAQRILEKTFGKVDGYQTDDGILSHECAISAVKELYEKKPAWSEEEEHYIRQLESMVKERWALAEKAQDEEVIKNMSNLAFFLKTLNPNKKPADEEMKTLLRTEYEKGRADAIAEMQKDWSEEDEKFFKAALWHISYSISNGESTDIQCDITEWLKSLRPQKQWKPSEEQLKQLGTAVSKGRAGYFNNDVLRELYVQLKQL